MNKGFKKLIAAAGIGAALFTTGLLPSSAGAGTLYTPPSSAPGPGALYARAMQTSNGKMYATFEQYTTGIATFPIYESKDTGKSWSKVGDVKDTKMNWGMRWEPHLYQLPQAIGNMPEGTLLASGLVLPYDESKCQIDLYKSNDEGRTWTFVSTVAEGKKPVPGNDPVWEPFLMVANNKLYVFYSDERDPDYTKFSQKLVHQSTTDGKNWSSVVDDVAISGQRPGMVVVTQMPNGNYLMVYEIIGVGGAYYKISSNIDSWNAPDKGFAFDAKGSSPYAVTMNGTVILSSAGNSKLYTNTNNGSGSWTQIDAPVGTGYSRCLVPLNNGRLFGIVAGWNSKGAMNKVTYGDIAFGCAPTAIVPSTKINDGQWRNSTSDTVAVGGTFAIGPQPNVATGWSWTGPNGYTATTREITLTNVTAAQAGTYTATYSNPSGCKSTQKFMLSVKPATSVLKISTQGFRGSKQLQLLLNNNPNLGRLDRNTEIRIVDLKGVSVYNTRIFANELALPDLKTGVYIINLLQDRVVLESKSFVIE